MDVVYLNRIQTERWQETCQFNPFVLTEDHLAKLKNMAIVLNPGPRREELPVKFSNGSKIRFWQQVENGQYIRMAILRRILCN
jgi:aspartate carbamoyltransferase catalytic subunit